MLHVIRLTPPGRGAVAVIRLSGPNALEVFARRFQGSLAENRPVFGRFPFSRYSGSEEVVVHVLSPVTVEICSHGGEAVVTAIEQTLIDDGAKPISWQDFFHPSDSQRDRAARLLPFAKTERTAQILLDQILLNLPEPPLGNERLGKHLVEPFRIALAGGTNVGKSSLLNAILGFGRSIVHHAPGTTRDIVSVETAIDGLPFLFCDTAGFRETTCDLERQGIERSSQLLEEVDLIVWIIDRSRLLLEQPPIPQRDDVLIVYNKSDLPERIEHRIPEAYFPLSAATGEGIEEFLQRIFRRFVPHPLEPLTPIPI
jgi:tRNA modification GTPase